MKTKTKMKKQNENKIENENQNKCSFLFSFCFSFSFLLLFLLSKSFCIFVNSTWSRGAIDGKLFLTLPRSAIAFSFANFAQGLAVT